jgi:hypothetical protein
MVFYSVFLDACSYKYRLMMAQFMRLAHVPSRSGMKLGEDDEKVSMYRVRLDL